MAKKRHWLSYLAGLFDGEGCVGITKASIHPNAGQINPTYTVYMSVKMCDEAGPRLFQSFYGGQFRIYPSQNPKWSTSYNWRVNGRFCRPILEELLPYIVIKRPQFEVALCMLDNIRQPGSDCAHPLTNKEIVLREANYILLKGMKGKNNKGGKKVGLR